MTRPSAVPASPAFDAIARDALFRDRIAILVQAPPAATFQTLHEVVLRCRSSLSAQFARYWRVIKPMGAFVTWQLLRAVRWRVERNAVGPLGSRRLWRSVRATTDECARALPGDERIARAIDTLTHGVTIRRPPRDVWPWLVQMGAGSRGGWYSYDWLDNGRRPSASRIVPELQHPAIGTIFPALPGVAQGFTLLAMEHERMLMLGWPAPDGTPEVTWTFLLDELAPGVTRLLVRARGGPGYRFHGLPLLLTRLVSRVAHFIMQRKQLLGIKRRAESTPAGTLAPWEEPCLPSHHTL